ncbi:MAG TPA: hypothetical protein DCW60_02800 [Sutterella sp.]|nr:hypothetical protein [Sutterella sp.]
MRLIYLHGLASSPKSAKGQILEAFAKEKGFAFEAPDLNFEPKRVRNILDALVKDIDPSQTVFVGSSLGGFYATYVCETCGARGILLNPACEPWATIEAHVGERLQGPEGEIEIQASFGEDLRDMALVPTSSGRYFVMLSTGDEVLDWHDALRKYARFATHVIEGETHRIDGFAKYLTIIEQFIVGSQR